MEVQVHCFWRSVVSNMNYFNSALLTYKINIKIKYYNKVYFVISKLPIKPFSDFPIKNKNQRWLIQEDISFKAKYADIVFRKLIDKICQEIKRDLITNRGFISY